MYAFLRATRPQVNFIYMFMSSFYACRSQKCKKLIELTLFFAVLGSVHVKAARKMLVKLTSRRHRRRRYRRG